MRLAGPDDPALMPHRRPRTAHRAEADSRAKVLELEDASALDTALQGVTTVLQLIGTVRKRFSAGDTYETSDVGTTRALIEAARRAGVDHFVLLSSVGAGRPVGAYLKAKARAESLVTESKLPFTIFRPSVFIGEGQQAPPGMEALTRLFSLVRYRPIRIEDLARAILYVARTRAALGAVLEGKALWDTVEGALRESLTIR
jgi:uncharacterized protein YbjT (DUF2867 family)